MDRKYKGEQETQANVGYGLLQLSKALKASQEHGDKETRKRAGEKAQKWMNVINGMLDGSLNIGSRTPLKSVPNWVTLEVVTGGFATGKFMAAGELEDHETKWMERFPEADDSQARSILNAYFLTEDGQGELLNMLHSECYNIKVPEEGALLVVAWLTKQGLLNQARLLIDELTPFFDHLRFYPIPSNEPKRFGTQVYLQDVKTTLLDLEKIESKHDILAQKEAIQIWVPLYDSIVSLFLETIQGNMPCLKIQAGTENELAGDYPCQVFPNEWQKRAIATITEYKRLRKMHQLCGKPERKKEHFAQLLSYLEVCAKDPKLLSGRDVGRIRMILAHYLKKRGLPGSIEWQSNRELQKKQTAAPTNKQLSLVVASRLKQYPENTGIESLENVLNQVTNDEAERWEIEAGISIPCALEKKVQRCLSDTIEVLVQRGIITSGETVAKVLPQVSSGIRASSIDDPKLRQLYAAIYRAFRLRRSLLLLNLESQVKIEELPWVAAIEQFRKTNLSAQEQSTQALSEIVQLTLTAFPQAIIPNKLLQELRALAKGASLDLPLVDEVAADIFMGEFTPKFLRAAQSAGTFLDGSLYERYYNIDYKNINNLEIKKSETKRRWFRSSNYSDGGAFIDVCCKRAGVKATWDPATNGMIIEQQQILTTQNLAVLYSGLELEDHFRGQLNEMAKQCFIWICQRQQMKINKWHAKLIMIKNTAYAWRQMVFFLSLITPNELNEFIQWAFEHLASQQVEFQAKFSGYLLSLKAAAGGQRIVYSSSEPRQFLGWSNEKHWLL